MSNVAKPLIRGDQSFRVAVDGDSSENGIERPESRVLLEETKANLEIALFDRYERRKQRRKVPTESDGVTSRSSACARIHELLNHAGRRRCRDQSAS